MSCRPVLICLIGFLYVAGAVHSVSAWLESSEAGGATNATSATNGALSALVDKTLLEELELSSGDLANKIDDEAFIRRVYLDVIGKLPDPAQIRRFVDSRDDNKRSLLVARLLKDEDYGKNWGRYWRDVIYFKRLEDRARLGLSSTGQFFANELNNNTGWDEIARQMITASGNVRDDGSTGLIMAQMGQPEETVSEISRVFLGIQIQCAQCHDHPTDRWEREQFHQLAAFFPRTAVRPLRNTDVRSFEVFASDRNRRRQRMGNNRYRGTDEHYMSDLDDPQARGTLTQPVFFLNGESLELGSTDKARRESLARWVTEPENEWFAKAFVNRVWAELVGHSFYMTIDDIGPDRSASADQTLTLLADGFVESDYDIKWLFRTIMATDAYQRASLSDESSERPFAANVVKRLRGDQLLDSVIHALGLPEDFTKRRRRRGGQQQRNISPNALRIGFNDRFGYDPSLDQNEVSASIPQVLTLMNSETLDRLLNYPGGSISRIARQNRQPEQAIEELYLQMLARKPTRTEIKTCVSHLKSVKTQREGFQDIAWALLNSAEFVHRY